MYNSAITVKGTTMYDTPIAVANKYGIAGGFLTYVYGWLTDANNVVLIGVLATLLGLVVSVVCQILKHRREAKVAEVTQELAYKEEARRKELHEALLSGIKAGTVTAPDILKSMNR